MKKSFRGYLYAVLSGVFYGIIPIFVVSIANNKITTNSGGVMIRYAVTSIMLLPLSSHYSKMNTIDGKPLFRIIVLGIAMSVTSISMYTSYRWLPAGIGMAISYLYPLLILLANILLCRKKLRKTTSFLVMTAFCGILLLCDYTILPKGSWKGVICSLISAFAYTVYIILQEEWELGKVHPIVFTEIISITCACCLGCFNLATQQFYVNLTAHSLFLFLALGVIGALSTATQMNAVKYVGSVYASVLGTLELVVCCLGSALILGDPFTAKSIVGITLILGVVIFITIAPTHS